LVRACLAPIFMPTAQHDVNPILVTVIEG